MYTSSVHTLYHPLSQNNEGECEDIAIVGMACRVPQAATVDQLWNNLINGVDSIIKVNYIQNKKRDKHYLLNIDKTSVRK